MSQMQVAFLHFHNAVVDHLRKKKENFTNAKLPGEKLFQTAQRLVRWHFWQIKWPFFFKFPRIKPQASRKIDAKLAKPLLSLPVTVIGKTESEEHPERSSLAVRNLLRGRALGLPSGQAVATAMGETPLDNSQLGLSGSGWGGEAPLWFYVLKEADLTQNGKRLGTVGGRIVAEVLLGLLDEDGASFVHAPAPFKSKRPIAPSVGNFTFADLVKFADVVEGGGSPGD